MKHQPITRPNKSGAYLRERRLKLGLSVTDVARSIGYTSKTIARIEREGVSGRMSFHKAYALTKAYQVNIDQLLELARQPVG